MALITDIESVVNQISSIISASISGKLTTIDTALGVCTTPPPAGYSVYEVMSIQNLPWIFIIPDNSESLIAGNTWSERDHTIIISCVVSSPEGDEGKCARRAYRYTRAIEEIFKANRTLTQTVIGTWITSVDYSPMWSDANGLCKEVRINTRVRIVG